MWDFFKVIKWINPVSYHLELVDHFGTSLSFHGLLLKRFVPGPLDEHEESTTPPLENYGTMAYTVKEILRSRHKGGKFKYQVDTLLRSRSE